MQQPHQKKLSTKDRIEWYVEHSPFHFIISRELYDGGIDFVVIFGNRRVAWCDTLAEAEINIKWKHYSWCNETDIGRAIIKKALAVK